MEKIVAPAWCSQFLRGAILVLAPTFGFAETELSGDALLAVLHQTPIECETSQNDDCRTIATWHIADDGAVTSTLSAIFKVDSRRFLRLDAHEVFSLGPDGLCTSSRAQAIADADLVFVTQPTYLMDTHASDIGEAYTEVFDEILISPIVQDLDGLRVCNRYFQQEDPNIPELTMRIYYDDVLRYEHIVRLHPVDDAALLRFRPGG